MPFHVAVEAEKLSKVVHSQARGVSSPGADALPGLSGRIETKDRGGPLVDYRRALFSDVPAFANAASISAHHVDIAIEAAQQGVGGMVAPGVEALTEPALAFQFAPSLVAAVELNTIASNGVEVVAVNNETLRAAPAKTRGDDFGLVVDLVAIGVLKPPDSVSISNQQSALSIEHEIVGSAGERSVGGLVDMEAWRQIELIVEQAGRVGQDGLQAGEGDEEGEASQGSGAVHFKAPIRRCLWAVDFQAGTINVR